MGSLSVFQIILILIIMVAYVWPMGLVIKRIGFSPWWALLMFITPLNIIGIWVLATRKWPRDGITEAQVKTFE